MFHKLLCISLFALVFNACKENGTKKVETLEKAKSVNSLEENKYPSSLDKVFNAHGGLNAWKELKTLEYSILKKEYTEKHTISLSSRKDKIETPDYSIGFNGENVWKLEVLGNFKGDPVFYHNLYFYFYAMPFVLADDGIIYAETPNLDYEGISYPGVKISYTAGIGTSSKDNYFVHYHPETHKMEWLGYTVTYRSGEVSDQVKWIRYKDWMSVGKVILPKSITWYDYEGRTLKEAKSTVTFKDVKLSKEEKLDGFYSIPEGAEYIKKE